MKKVWTGIGISVLVLFGGYVYLASQPEIVYVKTVADEVASLEEELKKVEVSVVSGALSPEDAVVAQQRIITRIKAIETATKGVEAANLSAEDKKRLADGLSRLTQILLTYRATLVAVDAKAETSSAWSPDTDSSPTIIESVMAVTDVVDDVVEDMVEGISGTDTGETLSEDGGLSDEDVEQEEITDTVGADEEMSDDAGASLGEGGSNSNEEVSESTEEVDVETIQSVEPEGDTTVLSE